MPIDIAYSNEVERLLDLLSAHMLAARRDAGRSPLASTAIVVPNRNVSAWIRLGVAERTGVAAALEFPYVESFFRRILAEALPDAEVLDMVVLQALLLEDWKGEPWKRDSDLEPIGDYVGRGRSERERQARLFDLAAAVARCFEDYNLSRRDYVETWEKHGLRLSDDPRYRAMERWQAALWRRCFGAGGLVESYARARGRKVGLLVDLFLKAAPLLRPGLLRRAFGLANDEVFFFGFSYLARTYVEMIQALAANADVHIFGLNPCAEPWDDVQTIGEEVRQARKRRTLKLQAVRDPAWEFEGEDPFGLDESDDNVLLKLWGRPGRNYIRILNELTGCEFLSLFADPGTDTLLHCLQSSILRREKCSAQPLDVCDGSLELWRSAGGIHREVEAIANEIWQMVARSGTGPEKLRFNDIAVVLPSADKALYEAEIGTVFRECHGIPHRIVDAEGSAQSSLLNVFTRFLESAGRDINRELVLGLLVHPATLTRHGGDADRWTRFAVEAGIFLGAHRDDLAATYIEDDIFNWDQGLVRLALGSIVAGEQLGEATGVRLGERYYLPVESETSSRASVRAFVVLARSMVADLEFLRKESRPFSGWAEYFRTVLRGYWGDRPGEEPSETVVRQRCLEAIASMDDLPADVEVEGATAARFLLDFLNKVKAGGSDFFTDGVVVASFLPMRPLPFRAVFVVGVGEGNFPSAEVLSPLDLRGARRRAYDVRPRDQDKYMFLETLLSVRERLVVSWVGRSESDGSAIEPSGLVKELLQGLRDLGASPAQLRGIEREIPLRRFDESLFEKNGGPLPTNLFPEAWRERAACHGMAVSGFSVDSSARPTAAHRAHLLRLPVLQKFLSEPLMAYAKYAQRIEENEYTEEILVRDEPLEADAFALRSRVRKAVVDHCLERGVDTRAEELPPDLDARLTHLRRKAQVAGEIPAGFLGHMVTLEENALAIRLLGLLRQTSELVPGARPVSFAAGCAGLRGSRHLPSLTLETCEGLVRIAGQVDLLFLGPEGFVLPILTFGAEAGVADHVGALVTLALLLSLGVQLPRQAWLAGISLKEPPGFLDQNKNAVEVRLPDAVEARRWLTLLAAQWLGQSPRAFLPLSAIKLDALDSDESLFARANEVFRKELGAGKREWSAAARLARLVGRMEDYAPDVAAVRTLRERLLPILPMLGKDAR